MVPKVAILLTVALGAVMAWGPVAAVADSNTDRFCHLWLTAGGDAAPLPTSDLTRLDQHVASGAAANARALAKVAPTKALKKSLKRVADFLGRIADAGTKREVRRLVTGKAFETYADDMIQVLVYAVTICGQPGEPPTTTAG